MKQYIPAFALALAVACSSGGDTPADNGDNGNNDPPPVALPTAVQEAMEACGFDSLAIFLQTFEGFADAIQPPGDAGLFTVIVADPEAGLFELELDLGDFDPAPTGTLSIADPETGLPPEGLDLSPFAGSLDGLAAALASSTGDVEVTLLANPAEGSPGGTLVARLTDGAVTSYEAILEVASTACALSIQAVDIAPTAFDGAYPDLTFDAVINLQTSEGAVRAEIEFDLDGTNVASADVTIVGGLPFTLLINLDTGAVTLAP